MSRVCEFEQTEGLVDLIWDDIEQARVQLHELERQIASLDVIDTEILRFLKTTKRQLQAAEDVMAL